MALNLLLTSLLCAFFMMLLLGKCFINQMHKYQKAGQPIRQNGPKSHITTKSGTVTMGGVLILAVITLVTFTAGPMLGANLSAHSFILLATLIGFGAIGFIDDYMKVIKNCSKGISAKMKFMAQVALAAVIVYAICQQHPVEMRHLLLIPKFGYVNLGLLFYPFAIFVIVGASNAVNLTDGLDGLVTLPTMLTAILFAYISNKFFESTIIALPIIVFLGATIGALLGFLWFNSFPAQIFMGDVGSLSLGAVLGAISIITKHELILAIAGGVFIAETASVIIQVASYKIRKKRVFLMAPLHHHFEKLGLSETKIVMRFWLVSAILTIFGVMLV